MVYIYLDKDYEESGGAVNEEFKVGDEVEFIDDGLCFIDSGLFRKRGKVIAIHPNTDPDDDLNILVEFEDWHKGHDAGKSWNESWYPEEYKTPSNSRWWCYRSQLKKINSSKENTEEKKEKLHLEPILEEIKEIQVPEWLKKIITSIRAKVSNFFIIWGNISDFIKYGDKYVYIKDLILSLGSQRDFVVKYDISEGIQLIKGDKEEFKNICGLKENPSNTIQKLLSDGQDFPRDPADALRILRKFLLNTDKKSLIIIDFAETVFPSGIGPSGIIGTQQEDRIVNVLLRKIADDKEIKERGHIIILLTKNIGDINKSLLGEENVLSIEIQRPDEKQRREFLKKFDLEEFSHATAGLNLLQIKDIVKLAEFEGRKLDIPHINSKKKEILEKEYAGILEVVIPKRTFDHIGGLWHIKNELGEIAKFLIEGKLKVVPMGILFMGPPGTGKSVMAEALAKEANCNMVKMGNIKEMWVGQSERNMTQFLHAIKSLTPVIVYVDEIDQILGRRVEFSGDSGVTRTLFGKILEIMSDTSFRGKILWIGATNRPDLLDPAMKRPGRFDLKIPFLYPETEERKEIIKALSRYYSIKIDISEKKLLEFAETLQGYSGAHIEVILLQAYKIAQRENRDFVKIQDLENARNDYLITDNQMAVEVYTLLALRETSFLHLIPRTLLEKARELEKKYKDKDLQKELSTGYRETII